MPTYTYQCDACGHAFDIVQKFSEDPLTVCPECEGHIRRVIQPTPIVFKGTGWYINDSKSKSSTTTVPKAEGADKPADAKPAETKAADAKPAAVESKPAAAASKSSE